MATKKQKGTKCAKIATQRNEFCSYRFPLKHQIERNLESKKISRKGEIPIDVKIATQRNEFCSYRFPFISMIHASRKSEKEKLKKWFSSKVDEIKKNPNYEALKFISDTIGIFKNILLVISSFYFLLQIIFHH